MKKISKYCAYAALAGLLIYGAVGRAFKSSSPHGPDPQDPVWKQTGQVWTRASLSQTKVVQGSDGLVYLQIDMTAPNSQKNDAQRKPTDFVIVLDRSGSMADARKMEYAKKAVESIINQLQDGDRFALVDFDSVVETPIPLAEVSSSGKNRFLAALGTIDPRGGTNLGGGLLKGIDEIKTAGRKAGHAQRLVLLSDGLANEGITDQNELNQIAARSVSGEFAVSTIGVGLDFNESLMASLADYGNGNYTFLEELASLDKVLAQEFYGASRVVAGDLRVDLDLEPGIELVEAAGYPVAREGGRTTIRPGHLYGGQKKTLFVTLRLPTDRGYSRSLGHGSLSYAINGRSETVSLFQEDLKVACVPPEKKDEAIASIAPGVYKEAWTQNNYGALLKANAEKVKSGDRAGALGGIGAYRAKLEEAYAAAPAPEMKQQLDGLKHLEGEVNDAFSGPDQEMKAKRLSKGYQYQGIQQQRKSN